MLNDASVALLIMEAEYIALSNAAYELIAHVIFSNFISIELLLSLPIFYTDNQATECITEHELEYQQSKYIDIRYHFVQAHFEKRTFDINHYSSDQWIADILTKLVLKIKHYRIVHTICPVISAG